MKWPALAACAFSMAACGTQAPPPDPGSGATVITVGSEITIRSGNTTRPFHVPGPVLLSIGSVLQFDFQEVEGAHAWGPPTSSDPSILSPVSTSSPSGYLVARFRASKQGMTSVTAAMPCTGTGCAAAGLRVNVVVGFPAATMLEFSSDGVNGSSLPDSLTCTRDGTAFSVLAQGLLAVRPYVLRIKASPYYTPGMYQAMGSLDFPPGADGSYVAQTGRDASRLIVNADERTGFLDAQFQRGSGQSLHIVGSFNCA
jgi:hypothetical protein